MQVRLFDEMERTDYGTAQYSEPIFVYWNRTARCEFDRARRKVEEWFDHYPANEQVDLRGRFRSKNDLHHQGAFFELFLHELLLRLGCQVTLHPEIPNVAKTPDFLVESPGEEFYIEATVASGESAMDAAAQARENVVYDVLNRRVYAPDYFLWLRVDGAPTTPPPANRIGGCTAKRLSKLRR